MNIELNKNLLQIITESGNIKGYQKSILTNTYTSGGGGMLINGQGYVAPPEVTTENTVKIDFFLEGENGVEKGYSLSGHDLRLRNDQFATLIWGKNSKKDISCLLGIYNHNANEIQFTLTTNSISLLELTGKKITLPTILNVLIFFFGFGFGPLFLVINYIRNTRINSKRKKIMNKIAHSLNSNSYTD